MERNMIEEIVALIKSDLANDLISQALKEYHHKDIAESFDRLTDNEREKLYSLLDKQSISDIFSYLENPEKYIGEMNHAQAADIIELMDADDAVDVLEELPEENRGSIIKLLEKESSEDIKLIAAYHDHTIGSMMTTNYITVPRGYTIKQAMKAVINEAPENDNIYTIFALNEDGTYYGSIDLKSLIIARKEDELETIIKTNYPILYADDSIEDSIQKVREYALSILPVLNNEEKLIGVITSDDVIEAFENQFSDDYAKLAGLSGEEYVTQPTLLSVRKRIPWLIILLFFDILISILISGFERVIVVLPMIVFFQSLILDMAGNVGTQSLGVAIRELTEGKLNKKSAFKLLFKEAKVGLINGLVLSINAFIVVFLFSVITKTTIVSGVPFSTNLALIASFVISAALLIAMTVSSVVGALIPIFFAKIKVDPAVASGPFITTINDIVAVIVYYGLAFLLFQIFIV